LRPSQRQLSESFQTFHSKLLLTPAAESDHDLDTTKIVKMTTVTLTSSDGVDITVDRDVAERSILIKNMLEDLGESDEAIPIPNVSLICTPFLSVALSILNSILLRRSTRWC
jgi:hypothetical protein